MSKVPNINIPANTEIKILSIREWIRIQKTISDKNSETLNITVNFWDESKILPLLIAIVAWYFSQ
ncbi:hypothetical protein H8356DRAFT_1359680 [Neocallimastix lanati (nom. inval.)]|nr:hypothetical protein H8356DRAFT_1359680 [Neocallimastix sp. JGI-2020a]